MEQLLYQYICFHFNGGLLPRSDFMFKKLLPGPLPPSSRIMDRRQRRRGGGLIRRKKDYPK